MGLLSGLTGHASEVTVDEIQAEVGIMLVQGEVVHKAFRVIRDLLVFTNQRLIMVNKQGMTGKKVTYGTIPYHSISHFSIESAGHFDVDSELRIYLIGQTEPLYWEFKAGSNLAEVQAALAAFISAS